MFSKRGSQWARLSTPHRAGREGRRWGRAGPVEADTGVQGRRRLDHRAGVRPGHSAWRKPWLTRSPVPRRSWRSRARPPCLTPPQNLRCVQGNGRDPCPRCCTMLHGILIRNRRRKTNSHQRAQCLVWRCMQQVYSRFGHVLPHCRHAHMCSTCCGLPARPSCLREIAIRAAQHMRASPPPNTPQSVKAALSPFNAVESLRHLVSSATASEAHAPTAL